MQYEVMEFHWMTCFPRVKSGEGPTGEDDEKVGSLQWVSKLEKDE